MKKVILIDDHKDVRTGLKLIINSLESFEVCGEAENSEDGFNIVKKMNPDIAVIDLNLSNSAKDGSLITKISALKIPVLVFSGHDERVYAASSLQQGARGYIMKTANMEDIIEAVRTVAKAKTWVSDRIAQTLFVE